jgi:hypothetical protein
MRNDRAELIGHKPASREYLDPSGPLHLWIQASNTNTVPLRTDGWIEGRNCAFVIQKDPAKMEKCLAQLSSAQHEGT